MADIDVRDTDRAERAHSLDEIDRILLRELVADGRATLAHLAAQAGLSVSAVQSRVRRLEARRAITGYTARVDPNALGEPLAAVVSVSPRDPVQPDELPARLQSMTGVKACHAVAGAASYILMVRVSTPAELERLLQDIRAAGAGATAAVILRTYFDR